MEIAKILCEIGINSYKSCTEIYGGKDSKVYKINMDPDITFALRVLPVQKLHQFLEEKEMIEIASANGIPVPKVYKINSYGDYSVMLMEWGGGQSLFHELIDHPENALKLGYEFGRVQASINRIVNSTINKETHSWLTPSMEEKKIIERIPKDSQNQNLVHLDYHPLNVLTDGKKVTAVIDWANSTFGDFRYDISRTLSILRLEGIKHFKKNPQVLIDFENGWRRAYEDEVGPLENLSSYSLFNAWSGLRMKRDLEGTLSENDTSKIAEWTTYWLNIQNKEGNGGLI